MESIKLKKCPFCGGEAMLMHYAEDCREYSKARCKYCGAETEAVVKSFGYSSDELAAEAWNRRVEE